MIVARRCLWFLSVLVFYGSGAAAQTMPSQEQLLIAPPSGWIESHNATEGTMGLTLFTPPGQSAESWTEALVVRVHHGLNNMQPEAFLSTIPAQVEEACDDLRAGKSQPGRINGYPAAFQFLECPLNRASNQGEVVMSLAIQGRNALYVIQRAWQTRTFVNDELPPVPQQTLDASVEYLRSVRVCDPVSNAHPCR